jgi:hypothetical protein
MGYRTRPQPRRRSTSKAGRVGAVAAVGASRSLRHLLRGPALPAEGALALGQASGIGWVRQSEREFLSGEWLSHKQSPLLATHNRLKRPRGLWRLR